MNIFAVINLPDIAKIFLKATPYDFCYLSTHTKLSGKVYPNTKIVNHLRLLNLDCYKNVKWNEIAPLSGSLIDNMARCESEVMQMFERLKGRKKNRDKLKHYTIRRKFYLEHLRFWNHVLSEHDFDVFFRSRPPHQCYDFIIHHLVRLKNIPCLTWSNVHPSMAIFAKSIRNPLPELLNYNTAKGKIVPSLNTYADQHWKKTTIDSPATVIPPWKKRRQKRRIKKYKPVLEYYASISIGDIPEFEYIYFPLHYQPEATTSPMGGQFVNQPLAVEILSRLGIPILVKEHPSISGNRSIEYYKHLQSLPNVVLVKQDVSSHALIDNALAVATITGTAGWEAILRGKPTMLFGYIYYQYAPGVFRVQSVEDAQQALEKIRNFSPCRDEIKAFLGALSQFLFPDTPQGIVEQLKKELSQLDSSS